MVRFDGFRLDPEGLHVFRDGHMLEAPPQVVEVLAYLIAQGDRIVPRQELLDRFWPRAGSGGDAALNTCVRRIRALLDDDAEAPRYIQTRPRAGYRFIGTATADPAVPVTPRPMPATSSTARPGLRIGGALAACLAVGLGIGGALWAQGTLSRPPPAQRLAIEPVQGLCEYVLFPRFNAGLRESLVAKLSPALPDGYTLASDRAQAHLHARVSVRQTPQQTVAVITLVDTRDGRLLWSREFAATTDTEDYVPLQQALAAQMAEELVNALRRQA